MARLLRTVALAILAAVALVFGHDARADDPPLVKTFSCEKSNGTGLSTGTDIAVVAQPCLGDTTHYAWGTSSFYVSECDVDRQPALCKLIQSITYTGATNSSDTHIGWKNISWSMKAGCGTPLSPASSGYYDIGPTAGATPLLSACKGTCKVAFDGTSPAGSAMVGGVKHFFAKGFYYYTGGECTAAAEATKQITPGTPGKPVDSCGANQGTATMNGKVVCVDQGGDGKTPTEESKDKGSTKTEKTPELDLPDGRKVQVETTTKTGADGRQEITVTRTFTHPDGSKSTETEVTNPGAADPSPSDGSEDDGEEKGPCEKNPSSAGCGGEPAAIGDLYGAKDKTMAGVLAAHSDAFMASPIGSAVGGFLVVDGTGSCPSFSAHIPFLDTDLTIDQFCTPFASGALAIFKGALLVVASFLAFRIAVE